MTDQKKHANDDDVRHHTVLISNIGRAMALTTLVAFLVAH
jgi:hypothetical protein